MKTTPRRLHEYRWHLDGVVEAIGYATLAIWVAGEFMAMALLAIGGFG